MIAKEADRQRRAICAALRRAIKEKGNTVDFVKKSGISSTTLYQVSNEDMGNPCLHTLVRVVHALGLELAVRPLQR